MSRQRNQHFVDPVSPALVKRVNAGIGRWEAGERDFYKEITEITVSTEELNDKEWCGLVSAELARMEELFAFILEKFPPTGVTIDPEKLPSIDYSEDTIMALVMHAMIGLGATASCRREIRAGRTAFAVREMHQATDLYGLTDMVLQGEANAFYIERSLAASAARKTSLQNIIKDRRREAGNRLVDFEEWRKEGLSKTQCWERAEKEWRGPNGKRISKAQARRSVNTELKRRRQEASRSPTDP